MSQDERNDYTFAAVERLRRELAEHERRGDEDTPFFIGIRATLRALDADRREQKKAA